MKRAILLAITLLLMLTSGALALAVERYEVLMPGDKDEYVQALQTALIAKGYLKDKATGYYGTNTTKAVIRFQQRYSLASDGIAGPKTQQALFGKAYTPIPSTRMVANANAAVEETQTLKLGSEGDAVKQLQKRLKTLGYYTYTKITSYFGPITEQAVRAFEQQNNLEVDGIVDKHTSNAIFSASAVKFGGQLSAASTAQNMLLLTDEAATKTAQNSTKASQLITVATGLLGVPYRAAGDSPTSGFDCSGFVYYCLKQIKINAPRSSAQQAAVDSWTLINSPGELVAGDLVFFLSPTDNTRIGHAGIYLGNSEFIHSSTNKGVIISSLNSNEYSRRFCWGRRMF